MEKAEYKNANGCGFPPFEKLVPDFIFTDACNMHDEMTANGGGLIAYLITNIGFFMFLLIIIEESNDNLFRKFLYFCYSLFMATYVLFFNWIFFKWGGYSIIDILKKLK